MRSNDNVIAMQSFYAGKFNIQECIKHKKVVYNKIISDSRYLLGFQLQSLFALFGPYFRAFLFHIKYEMHF